MLCQTLSPSSLCEPKPGSLMCYSPNAKGAGAGKGVVRFFGRIPPRTLLGPSARVPGCPHSSPRQGEAAPLTLYARYHYFLGEAAQPAHGHVTRFPAAQPPTPRRRGVGTGRAAASPLDSWILPAVSKTSRHRDCSRPACGKTGSRRGRNREHADIYKFLHDTAALLWGQASLGNQQEDFMQEKQTIFLFKAMSVILEPPALTRCALGASCSERAVVAQGSPVGPQYKPVPWPSASCLNSGGVHETLSKNQN